MNIIWKDLTFSVRMLVKNPFYALVAVIAIALGIGANTAIFSVVNAVLIRPLPFKDPERLVEVRTQNLSRESEASSGGSPADFWDWQEQSQRFEQMSAIRGGGEALALGEHLEVFPGASVSTNFFETLGVKPLFGRTFVPQEGSSSAPGAVVISYRLWQERFGGDSSVVGRAVKTAEGSTTIIGVMPPDFKFPASAEIWTPMARDSGEMKNRANRYFGIIARLGPGQSMESAEVELKTIAARLENAYPATNKNVTVSLVSLRDSLVGKVRSSLLFLLGAVCLVLLIACANVASLLLVRAESRRKEMAIRGALGASRWRLTRQLLTESVLLALIGGTFGLLLSLWGVDLLMSLLPKDFSPAFQALEIHIDKSVLLFTLLASVLTGLFFGIIPAWQSSRAGINESLKESGRSMEGRRNQNARGLLVITEVALALVLLIGAGLLLQSFARLRRVDLGYDPHSLLTMPISAPFATYPDGASRARLYKQMLERVSQTPGVESVALTCGVPFGYLNFPFNIEGTPLPSGDAVVRYDSINADYFKTLKARMVAGREFTAHDTERSPKVAIINHALARQYFADADPLGRQISFNYLGTRMKVEIVGIVSNIKQEELQQPTMPQIYAPFEQAPWFSASMVVRPAGANTLAIKEAVQKAIWEVDPNQSASKGETLEETLTSMVAEPRLYTVLLGSIAALALVLSVVGVYGVISYSVAQQTHEIGIRMALGAQAGDVLRMVIKRGMLLVLIGIAIGLAGAFAGTRVMQSLLFGVSVTDPLTFVTVSVLLAAVALLACCIPARRATKVDPLVALRYE
jgi:putative ABC transport system permease protein